uniref:Uncharacterized protein n=1 Tax=Anguilla anguilla TaxID=7936 RepID=A0A0E9QC62_ANGAN
MAIRKFLVYYRRRTIINPIVSLSVSVLLF